MSAPVLRFLCRLSLLCFAGGLAACTPPRNPASPSDPGPADPSIEYLSRQEILTDLPMRVRLPARYGAERVFAFVHLWGTRGWKTIELERAGQSWDGAVSCRDVSTVTGDTQYFFLAVDSHGDSVVSSGSPEWPNVVTIVRSLPEGAQSLPNHPPPMTCHDTADCPSDFAGCPAYAAARAACESDDDCQGDKDRGGRCAWDGYCEGPSEPEGDSDALLAAAVRKVVRNPRTASSRLSADTSH